VQGGLVGPADLLVHPPSPASIRFADLDHAAQRNDRARLSRSKPYLGSRKTFTSAAMCSPPWPEEIARLTSPEMKFGTSQLM